jgi:hypothetical protein
MSSNLSQKTNQTTNQIGFWFVKKEKIMTKIQDNAKAMSPIVFDHKDFWGIHLDCNFHIGECPGCQKLRLIISRKRATEDKFLHVCKGCYFAWSDTTEPENIVDSFKEILGPEICPFCNVMRHIIGTVGKGETQPFYYRCLGCNKAWQVVPPQEDGTPETIVELFK